MAELPARPSSVSNCTAPAGGSALPCVLDSTIVEFRPKLSYQGEFGFDWLRVKEAPTTGLEKEPYIDNPNEIGSGCVIGGYKGLTELEAQKKMMGDSDNNGEYIKFTINRPKTNFRHLTYYVPYLNLYPKNGFNFVLPKSISPPSDLPPLPTYPLPAPPHTAELRMIIDVKGAAPEKIEIEFDPEYFEINGKRYVKRTNDYYKKRADKDYVKTPVDSKPEPYKYVIERHNYSPTPDNKNTSRDVTVLAPGTELVIGKAILKITCLKEFDTDQYIKAYAYPAGSSMKSKEEQIQVRKLAGQLVVCANSKPNRRVQKIVLVRVITNTQGTPTGEKIGNFSPREIQYLYKTLYQALILPLGLGNEIIWDMSKDEAFTYTEKNCGKFINMESPSDFVRSPVDSIPEYLRRRFFEIDANKKYKDYLTVFSFDVARGSVSGQSQRDSNGNFVKNLALFKYRDQSTLSHEIGHALGLFHTHLDKGTDAPNQKYRFSLSDGTGEIFTLLSSKDYKRATSNIMSYKNGDNAYSTWRWQWLIMKRNTSVES